MRTENDAHQQWSCNRKKAYPSLEMAQRVADKIMARDPTANLVGYSCGHCGRFHIGRMLSEG